MTSPMPITGLKSAFERGESGVSHRTTKSAEEPFVVRSKESGWTTLFEEEPSAGYVLYRCLRHP